VLLSFLQRQWRVEPEEGSATIFHAPLSLQEAQQHKQLEASAESSTNSRRSSNNTSGSV